MAYNDILGEKKKPIDKINKDSIIAAQRDNIQQKQKLIENLIDQITELEKIIESQDNQYGHEQGI